MQKASQSPVEEQSEGGDVKRKREKKEEINKITFHESLSHPAPGSLIKRVGHVARPSGKAEVSVIRPEADAEHVQSVCLFIQQCTIASTCHSTRCVYVCVCMMSICALMSLALGYRILHDDFKITQTSATHTDCPDHQNISFPLMHR